MSSLSWEKASPEGSFPAGVSEFDSADRASIDRTDEVVERSKTRRCSYEFYCFFGPAAALACRLGCHSGVHVIPVIEIYAFGTDHCWYMA
ncbi:hypothetical protein EY04_23865 [Pseudomonas chlororaphis]|nr:hypothetical protein EY04_23865 [Pseudomonas chlororaphis]